VASAALRGRRALLAEVDFGALGRNEVLAFLFLLVAMALPSGQSIDVLREQRVAHDKTVALHALADVSLELFIAVAGAALAPQYEPLFLSLYPDCLAFTLAASSERPPLNDANQAAHLPRTTIVAAHHFSP
jgi:hypothetical protein